MPHVYDFSVFNCCFSFVCRCGRPELAPLSEKFYRPHRFARFSYIYFLSFAGAQEKRSCRTFKDFSFLSVCIGFADIGSPGGLIKLPM
jgi:hypothetical protein